MKRINLLLIGFLFLLILFGCNAMDSDKGYDGLPNDEVDEEELKEINSTVNRKIIYTVNAHISTNDLDATYKSIKNSLESDEWADYEGIDNGTANLTLRIKTSRLDGFIKSLDNYGEVGNFKKEAKDVSLQYENNASRIASLEAELARLNDLYLEASIHEMITISTRISEIDREIKRLRGELSMFDSLVDYSVVNLKIYEHKLEKEPSFGSSIGKAFIGGWDAVVTLLKYLVIGLSAMVPFLVVIVPIGGAIYFGVNYSKKKKIK